MTKLEKFVLRWLNDNYNHMEPFLMEEYPDYIFHMKNGKCILQHSIKNGYVYVSYSEIWKFLESMFCMENQQIKDLTKKWVEEHYKVGVTKTSLAKSFFPVTVEEHYKMKPITTKVTNYLNYSQVEGRYEMKVKSTQEFGWRLQKQVDEQYKKSITTISDEYSGNGRVEEQYKEITTTPIENHRVCNEIENQYKEIQTTNNQLEFYSEKDVEELYEQNIN
jgi:hypothetical protein